MSHFLSKFSRHNCTRPHNSVSPLVPIDQMPAAVKSGHSLRFSRCFKATVVSNRQRREATPNRNLHNRMHTLKTVFAYWQAAPISGATSDWLGTVMPRDTPTGTSGRHRCVAAVSGQRQ